MRLAEQVWRVAGRRPDLFAQIDAMLQRIRRDRGSTSDELDFKTGSGGIIEAEFLIQALQMRAGIWNTQTIGALEKLAEAKVVRKSDADDLRKHYEYLRKIESVLRRWEHKSVSVLPNDKFEQEKVAIRIGAESLDAFAQSYRAARTGIHEVYARYFS